MYPSHNNSCNCTNPINNVSTIPSSYRNGCGTQSSPKVIPRNQHNAASTQVYQQNNWDSNKSASTPLPTSYLGRLYKLGSIKNNDEMSMLNSINTQDCNDSQISNKNELNFQTPKTKKFDEVYLSVNRRTQPGILAAIKLLSQNLKPKINPNNEVIDDSNSKSITTNIVTTNTNTKGNNQNKIFTNGKNDNLSTVLPHSSGVEYSSWKDKRYSYTPTFTNHNYGNNIGNNYNNISTSIQTINNEDTDKLANNPPGKMMKVDSSTLMKPSLHNNSNNEIYLANSNSPCTTNFSDNKNNMYSPLCTRTSNYDTLFKRSSSTSPYRPLLNYRPSWLLSSNHKMLSNETLYNSVDYHNEYVASKPKYLDSKISNNNISNKYRPSDNGTTTGTQTPMTAVISQNLQGSLTTLSSSGGIGSNNATRYLNKNDHFSPRLINAKPSFHSRQNIDDVNMEQNDEEHHKYGRTYYITRRPQIIQTNYQKHLPHAINHERNLSFNNIYDASTLIDNTDTTDHDFDFTNKTINKKINRMPDVLKPNSYLSNSTLASYKRNSSSLNSLPNEIGSSPSLIHSEYVNDDHRIGSNNSDNIVANRSIFDNYSPIYYPNNQTLYTARRYFQADQSQPSPQTKYSYHQDNPESFRSFSVSPEIGSRISENSIMSPCRSYNENLNMIGSNSNLRLCSSAPSPLKRKPYQVSFNLDRNTYIEYPYSESSTSLVQCKRVPGYISSSGATPGETNVNFKTSPKYPFSWSNENGVTTIGKVINGYDNEYSKQINYSPRLYTSWPIRPKYNRYSPPPPQPTLNHDGDNINFNCSTTDQTAIIDPFTSNSNTAHKPEIRFIDTTLSSPGNCNLNSNNNLNTNKPPVFGRSLNSLKLLLSKSTHRFDANSNNNSNTNPNGGKSLFKQIEQYDSTNPRHSSAIDILNQRSSFCS